MQYPLGGFNVQILVGTKRRMIDNGKKLVFTESKTYEILYFFERLHLKFFRNSNKTWAIIFL